MEPRNQKSWPNNGFAPISLSPQTWPKNERVIGREIQRDLGPILFLKSQYRRGCGCGYEGTARQVYTGGPASLIERGHWVRISRAKARCFTDSSWLGVSGLREGVHSAQEGHGGERAGGRGRGRFGLRRRPNVHMGAPAGCPLDSSGGPPGSAGSGSDCH